MRVAVTLFGLLLLAVVVGCEGNSPRRSPFAASSSPTTAKPVEFVPVSKNPLPGSRPLNPTDPTLQPDAGNPDLANQNPVNQNPADNPNPAGNQISINQENLDKRRQETGYHTAVFLRKEIGALIGTGVQENNNFVTRPAEGLDKLKIAPAVSAYRAEHGKAPQSINDFLKLMEENAINLAELNQNEFYIYDPALAAMESSRENLDYLQQYP